MLAIVASLALIAAGTLPAPPAADPPGAIAGAVTRHGFPVNARVEVRLLRPVDPEDPGPPPDDAWRPAVAGGPPLATVETDGQGRCSVAGLAPAEYEVLAVAPWGEVARCVTTVFRPGNRSEVQIGLDGACRTLAGKARWLDGRPFAGTVGYGGAAAPTDAEGRFVLKGAPAGPDSLAALSPGVIAREFGPVRADESGDVPIIVDRGLSSAAGRVIAAETGAPVAGAEVLARGVDGDGRTVTTGARSGPDGRYRILLGEFELVSPVAGDVMVFAFGRGFVTPGLTDERVAEDGTFSIPDAPTGPVRIHVFAKVLEPEAEATVVEGVSDVRLTVGGGDAVTVRVAGWPGDRGIRASLSWEEPVGHGLLAREMPESGRVRFHYLTAARRFLFHAGPLSDGRIAWGEVAKGSEGVLDLTPGLRIRGRFVLPDGARVTDVYASLPSGFLIRGRAAAGGGYEVAGLPPGRATVHVEVRVGFTEYVGSEEVEAGGTADIRLRPR